MTRKILNKSRREWEMSYSSSVYATATKRHVMVLASAQLPFISIGLFL